MISQFFILTPRGDTVVSKDYRGDCPRGAATAATASQSYPTTLSLSDSHPTQSCFVRPQPRPLHFLARGPLTPRLCPPGPVCGVAGSGMSEIFFRKLKSYNGEPPPIFVSAKPPSSV